jgi:hypothetical protein
VPSSSAFLTRSGSQLTLGGQPYRSVGVDAYELATDYPTNVGCGGMLDDAALDAFFAGLPAGSTVRMWGFQGSFATNPVTRARDWTGLDRVVAAAARHGDHLVVSLGNQDGDCDDGHWKDSAWYLGGYRNVYPGNAVTIATVSYWDWVHEIVNRYRSSPTVAMWELINEPEGSDCSPGYSAGDCYGHNSCSNGTNALRSFFDVVGTEVKHIDPNHLVESGLLGGEQCGSVEADYATTQASPGIDVVSFHDYHPGVALAPELALRVTQANALGKPLLVGELGLDAAPASAGCMSLAARQAAIAPAVTVQIASGIPLILFWDWVPGTRTTACTTDISSGDPLLGLLGQR